MLSTTLKYLFPDIDFLDQVVIEDDGTGPRIASWNRPEPQPTQAEIEAAYPAAQAQAARDAIRPVTRRQMLTALHRAGMLTDIKAAVAASDDVELQIAFDEALDFERSNPFIAGMAAMMGKTDDDIDGLFALAATI